MMHDLYPTHCHEPKSDSLLLACESEVQTFMQILCTASFGFCVQCVCMFAGACTEESLCPNTRKVVHLHWEDP